MALETFTGIWSLNPSNPAGSDDIRQGDDHLRGLKNALKRTFPRVSSTASVTGPELSHLSGAKSNIQNQINRISGSLSTAEDQISTLSESLSAEISRVDMLSASLAQATSDITRIDESLSAEIARSNILSASLAQATSDITRIDESLSAEIARSNTLSASLSQVISDVEELSKSVAAANAYGSLLLHDNTNAFSSTTSLSTFNSWDIPGPTHGITVSTASGAIAVDQAGTYEVFCHMSLSGSADTVYTLNLFRDVTTANFGAVTKTKNNGEVTNLGFMGHLSASAGQEFTVRMKQDQAGEAIVVSDGQFVVKRLN